MGLIPLILILVGSSLCLPFFQAKRWAFTLWGPVVAFDLMLLKQLLGPLAHVNGGGGPDAGYVGMAVGFYLAFAAPICALAVISLIIAGFSFPRAAGWNGWGIGLGMVTTAISIFGFIGQTTPEVTIAVVDSKGEPMPDETVSFATFQFGSGRSLGEGRTGKSGEVRIRIPPRVWSASLKADDGVTSAIGVGQSSDSFLEPNSLILRQWWSCREWGWLQPRFASSGAMGNQSRFELRLREADEITSKWMSEELHRGLLETLHEGRHASALTEMCDNLESFDEFPLLGQIAKKAEPFPELVSAILNSKADSIDRFERMLQAGERGRWSGVDQMTYSAICRWLGLDEDSKKVRETGPKIREHLHRFADELLTTAEPLWKTYGPVGFHLRSYAKAAAPRLLHAMEGKDEAHAGMYWFAVESARPDVIEMEPFFASEDRYVAASAIAAVWDRLSPAQASIAVEQLGAISHAGENSWFQHRLDELIPKVRARVRSESQSN